MEETYADRRDSGQNAVALDRTAPDWGNHFLSQATPAAVQYVPPMLPVVPL